MYSVEHGRASSGQPLKEGWVLPHLHLHPCPQRPSTVESYTSAAFSQFYSSLPWLCLSCYCLWGEGIRSCHEKAFYVLLPVNCEPAASVSCYPAISTFSSLVLATCSLLSLLWTLPGASGSSLMSTVKTLTYHWVDMLAVSLLCPLVTFREVEFPLT